MDVFAVGAMYAEEDCCAVAAELKTTKLTSRAIAPRRRVPVRRR
jgi:hypothetical protein